MLDMLSYIIKNIVTLPDDVKVEESVDETGTTIYTVSVNPADVGRIIGKEGKVIKAIRTIARVVAIQKGTHVRISVLSDTDEVTEESAPVEATPTPTENELSVEV